MHKQSYLPAGKASYIAYLCHSQDSPVPGRESTSGKTRQENKRHNMLVMKSQPHVL